MNLVIVESPTKARKLVEYLGKNYTIEASVGHVRDLPNKKLGVDLDNNFEPTYEVDPEKKKVVNRLKELAAKADVVYLATDPDREGEAIAWHLHELLAPDLKGQAKPSFVRATFHEITKQAVQAAINNPSQISQPLVDAQQARRVVDRLVGYKVSPVLWRKVRRGLSAGRVQSVALRMIAEREREIEAFKPDEYWEVDVTLQTNTQESLVTRLSEVNGVAYLPVKEADVTGVVAALPTADYTVASTEKKKRERSSLPPFTTSTLQQAASTRLGFTSKQTMSLAQQLYEEGLITYHRTDSVSLAAPAVAAAREHIQRAFGPAYLPEKPRLFATKTKNAQEAHEAVRVTDAELTPDQFLAKVSNLSERHHRLYDLIWRRFIASQMNSAVYDQTSIVVKATASAAIQAEGLFKDFTLKVSGSILSFPGWMTLFTSQEDVMLPAVTDGQALTFSELASAQKFTQPPPRFNDASLVKELEKRGIGRPSTYASIISVIVDRGYVERREKRFFATQIGMTVSEFLQQHFPVFMEYDFTAEMEENLDSISRGEKPWKTVVGDFYQPLSVIIDKVVESADRVQIPVEETGENCPKCHDKDGGMIVIRTGRFGKFRSCNRYPECDFTENIVEKLENVVCPLCQQGEVIIKQSRWGKGFFGCSRYPACDWASWQKPQPGLIVTPAEWAISQAARAERAAAKKAAMAEKNGGAKSTAKKTTAKKTAAKTTKKRATKKTTSKKKTTKAAAA